MSDSCPVAYHKQLIAQEFLFFFLSFVLQPDLPRLIHLPPVHETLGTPHAMACLGKVGRAVTANSQGSHCLLLWPKPTPGNSFPTMWFAQFTPTGDRDELRGAESSLKSPWNPQCSCSPLYTNPCRQPKWRRNQILFPLGLKWCSGSSNTRISVLVCSSGTGGSRRWRKHISEKTQAAFAHPPCLPVWLLSQRTQVCLGHAWTNTWSPCQPESRNGSQICNIRVGMAVIRRVGTILFLCSS